MFNMTNETATQMTTDEAIEWVTDIGRQVERIVNTHDLSTGKAFSLLFARMAFQDAEHAAHIKSMFFTAQNILANEWAN